MKKFALVSTLATAGTAMAQTTNTLDLAGLLGGGAVGLVVLVAIIFFGWRWWFGGN